MLLDSLLLQGIGNGLPLAAVVTTAEIAETLSRRTHFNTYGGNPVSSSAGRAVLRAVDEDGLQANSAKARFQSICFHPLLKQNYSCSYAQHLQG